MDVFTFLVGGKAGEGVKKAGLAASNIFIQMGRNVFVMDDYQSLIKGGHNFSAVSTSKTKISSQYIKSNLVIALDKRSYLIHKDHLAEDGLLVYNSDLIKEGEIAGIGIPLTSEANKFPNPELRIGVSSIAILCAVLGLDENELKVFISSEYSRDLENNIAFAVSIFNIAVSLIKKRFVVDKGDNKGFFLSGNEAIALGAYAGGADIYFAYPMTPATSILHFLSSNSKDFNITVIHPENEIAVINMAIGSVFAGAKAFVGTSGGGFALMQEAFSLAGITEAPVLCVNSTRPGPSTGVPTYTSQGDLRFILNQGHGEFPRIVASPGSIEEAFYLTAEILSIIWKFQIPGIITTEKHLSESRMTVNLNLEKSVFVKLDNGKKQNEDKYKRYLDTASGVSPLIFPPSEKIIKWNSYEHDEFGITIDEPDKIIKMQEKRNRKNDELIKHLKAIKTVNIYGEEGVIIFVYGSVTMSVLEAVKAGNIKARVVQPIYLDPLPVWELERFKEHESLAVEQSLTEQFAVLLKEKAGINVSAVIKKYDGRPFDPLELAEKIKEKING